jgi:hypothetical protein
VLKFIASLFASSAPKSSAANTARLELNTMEDRMAPARFTGITDGTSNTLAVRTLDDGPTLSPLSLNLHNYHETTGFFGQ